MTLPTAHPKPKPKRTKKRSSRRYALMLLRRLVLERDNLTCQMCGKKAEPHDLEVAHLIARQMGGARLSVMFDPQNVVLFDRDCHRLFDGVFDRFSWSENYLGKKRWAELLEKAKQPWHRDYQRVIDGLKALLKEQEGAA